MTRRQVTVTSVRIFKPADLIHLHPVGSSFTGTPSTRRIGARCGRSVPTSTPTPSNRRFRTGRRWRWWKAWIFGFSAREALRYAQERRSGLEVFLDDPEVAIDTNHLERALRPIPLGKRNWLFTSSEVGAQRVGIIRSLLVTCRLHEVDACTCLVDMLQRISVHPANRAIELTPRMWKSLFADAPMRSDLGPHHRDPPSHRAQSRNHGSECPLTTTSFYPQADWTRFPRASSQFRRWRRPAKLRAWERSPWAMTGTESADRNWRKPAPAATESRCFHLAQRPVRIAAGRHVVPDLHQLANLPPVVAVFEPMRYTILGSMASNHQVIVSQLSYSGVPVTRRSTPNCHALEFQLSGD